MLQQIRDFAKRPWSRFMMAVILALVSVTAVFLAAGGQTGQARFLPVVMNHASLSTPPPVTPNPCGIQFVATPVAGQFSPQLAGQAETIVSIVDLTSGETIGTDQVLAAPGHQCPGLADFAPPYRLNQPLAAGRVLQAQSDDNSMDTAVVAAATPMARQANEKQRLSAPQVMTTTTPSATPPPGNEIQGVIYTFGEGGFLPQSQALLQLIDELTGQVMAVVTSDANGAYRFDGVPAGGDYTVYACQVIDGQAYFGYRTNVQPPQDLVYLSLLPRPCPAGPPPTPTPPTPTSTSTPTFTPTPTSTSTPTSTPTPSPTPIPTSTHTPTPTPAAWDLTIGQPALISTPPIVAYQPLQFSMLITNAGSDPINEMFFIDLFLDPAVVLTTTIPITESDGYMAISGLSGGESRVVTIIAPFGFGNTPSTHLAYGMADSLTQIAETNETNNISSPLIVQVTPAVTPIPTSTPGGSSEISGGTFRLDDEVILQPRTQVRLIDDASGTVIAVTESDENGFYIFDNVPVPGSAYTVAGCITIDNGDWYGTLSGIVPPNTMAHIIMVPGPCP